MPQVELSSSIDEILAAIIRVGSTGTSNGEFSSDVPDRLDELNREHFRLWDERCSRISQTDVENLFKGLVLVERDYNLTGGSVAANIWVLKYISRTYPERHAALLQWGYKNRGGNDYTPSGRSI